jgi:MFS family permease
MDAVRKNFVVGVIHETLWGVSFAMMDPVTVMQLALKELGGTTALAGLLGGLLFAGMSLAQLPAAFWLGPRNSDPARVARLHLPALACTGGLALAFSLGLPAPLLLKVFIVLASAFFILIGPVIPFWITMIGRCIPEGGRGRYFGWAFGLANLCGVASGSLAVRWIGEGGLRWGYAATFGTAMALQIVSITLLLGLTPLQPAGEAPGALRPWLREQWGQLLNNRPFRLFLGVTVLMQLSSAPYNLYTDYLKQHGLPTTWWFPLTVAKGVGGLVGAGLMGWLADARGPRHSLGLGFVFMALSLILIPLAGHVSSLGAFFGASFFGMAYPVINLYMLIRLAGPEQTTALSSTFAAVTAPLILGAAAASGLTAQHFGFGAAYGAGLAACVLGVAFLLRFPFFPPKEAA